MEKPRFTKMINYEKLVSRQYFQYQQQFKPLFSYMKIFTSIFVSDIINRFLKNIFRILSFQLNKCIRVNMEFGCRESLEILLFYVLTSQISRLSSPPPPYSPAYPNKSVRWFLCLQWEKEVSDLSRLGPANEQAQATPWRAMLGQAHHVT